MKSDETKSTLFSNVSSYQLGATGNIFKKSAKTLLATEQRTKTQCHFCTSIFFIHRPKCALEKSWTTKKSAEKSTSIQRVRETAVGPNVHLEVPVSIERSYDTKKDKKHTNWMLKKKKGRKQTERKRNKNQYKVGEEKARPLPDTLLPGQSGGTEPVLLFFLPVFFLFFNFYFQFLFTSVDRRFHTIQSPAGKATHTHSAHTALNNRNHVRQPKIEFEIFLFFFPVGFDSILFCDRRPKSNRRWKRRTYTHTQVGQSQHLSQQHRHLVVNVDAVVGERWSDAKKNINETRHARRNRITPLDGVIFAKKKTSEEER